MVWRYLDSLTEEIHEFGKRLRPKKLKAKRKKQGFPWWVLLLLLIPLSFCEVPLEKTITYTESVPYQQQAAASTPAGSYETICDTRDFSYTENWEAWQTDGTGRVSPTLLLSNNQAESGAYTVQFAFFDGTLYPYENFNGIDYEDVAAQLPWQAATMIAEQRTYQLRARQTIEINQFVILPDYGNTQYWVYADIQAPTTTSCRQIRSFAAENRTVTKYRDEQRVRIVEEKVAIWRWLWVRLR